MRHSAGGVVRERGRVVMMRWFRRLFGSESGGSAPPAALAAVTAATDWEAFIGSELSSWFGMHETGRTPTADGGATVALKPGGSQESIDCTVHINAGGRVDRADLELARAWVDDRRSAAFAFDIAKGFVPVAAPASARARELSRRLEWLMSQSVDIARGPLPPELPPPPDAEIDALLRVWANRQADAALVDGPCRIVFENVRDAGPERLRVSVRHNR
jgi:hypothetical protein